MDVSGNSDARCRVSLAVIEGVDRVERSSRRCAARFRGATRGRAARLSGSTVFEQTIRMSRSYVSGAALLAAVIAVATMGACGSDSTGPDSGTVSLSRSSGDSQTVVAKGRAPSPIAVLVTKGGAPQPGVSVAWSIAGGGGTL